MLALDFFKTRKNSNFQGVTRTKRHTKKKSGMLLLCQTLKNQVSLT